MSKSKSVLGMLAACAALVVVGAAPSSAAITLDGVADAGYGAPIATDPAGDLASPGPADWNGVAWTDLTALRVTHDATTLYIHTTMPGYDLAVSEGRFGIAIDAKNTPGGGTTDPWGGAITFAQSNLPDFFLRGNTPKSGGWTELRTWNGSNWDTGGGIDYGGVDGGTGVGTNVVWSNGNGLEVQIPLATLGVGVGDTINLFVFGNQEGGTKGAFDSLPSDDQSNGWDDATTNSASVPYTITAAAVPEPATLGLLSIGALAALRRRRSH